MSQSVAVRGELSRRLDKTQSEAYVWGLAGVLMFSGGIVATRMAVLELPPIFVGAGRAAVAGILSLCLLILLRQPLPKRQYWPGLAIVAFGAAFAFPVFTEGPTGF